MEARNWFETAEEFETLCRDAVRLAKGERAEEFTNEMLNKARGWKLSTPLSQAQLDWLCKCADWVPPLQRSPSKVAEAMVPMLTFTALRAANTARLPLFKNKHGALAHSEKDGSDWSDAQWCEAVLGELGEYANIHKKLIRGDLSREEFMKEAADELADVVTYIDILAFRLGIDLGEAVRNKFNRVSDRVGVKIKLP